MLPRALGVRVLDGSDPMAQIDPERARFTVVHLLHAGASLPADSGPFTFHTSVDGQNMVDIEVWNSPAP